MRRALVACGLLFLAAWPSRAFAAGDTKEVEDCMRRNLPAESLVTRFKLIAKDKAGGIDEKAGTLYWRRKEGLSSIRLLMSQPPDLRGAGILLLERPEANDVFLYLPEIKRVRRVTGRTMSGSVFGTDFTYEQLQRVQQMAKDAKVDRTPDDELGGRSVYVLEGRPLDGADSEFERVVSFVDKPTCLPLKMFFYGSGGKLQRELETDRDSITKEKSGFVARRIVARDLRNGTESELLLDRIEVGNPLPERDFSQAALEAEGR